MAENTVMTQDVLASLKNRLKDNDIPIFQPVPKSIRFPESNLAGQPIHIYANDPKYVKPYQAIMKIILGVTK
jgi:chromosome partitioning protein